MVKPLVEGKNITKLGERVNVFRVEISACKLDRNDIYFVFVYSASYMKLTEEKIRQIAREAMKVLGNRANHTLVRRVVKEVVNRLQKQASNDHSTGSSQAPGY